MARLAGGLSLASAVAALAVTASAMARTVEDITRTAADAIRGLDLQLDLPREPEAAMWRIPLPQELVWGALILGVLLLLYFFLKEVVPGLSLSSAGADWEEGGGGESGAPMPEEAALAADELARQGRFVEAMHALLLQALADIRQRRDHAFAESLTSREILRRVRLSAEGEASLRDIVARVEWSYFGEHPAGSEDYRHCRDSFDRLAAALRDAAVL